MEQLGKLNNTANDTSSWAWDSPRPYYPLGVLDLFLPGSSSIKLAELVSLGLNNYTSLVFLTGLFAFAKMYATQLSAWFKTHFTSTTHVRDSDLTYDMLMAWFSTRGLHNDARSTIARIGTSKAYEEDFSMGIKYPISFAPWNACFLFWFRNHLLSYRSGLKDDGFHKVEEVSITCAGRSSRILQDFMRECREEYICTVENKTVVFENCGNRWTKAAEKGKRRLSSVMLSEGLKEELMADVTSFVRQDTREWFAEKSIPHRRGYLLHGPPGTGKSSFSFALAGDLDINLYTISLPGVNDDTLKTLFADLPSKCVVLLEDIDAVGLDRSTHPDALHDESSKRNKGPTLSGLLNTLDGVGSKEGRILIMTTNHIDNLDKALIRAGRVDKMAEFELADASVISQLFGFIFGHTGAASKTGSCASTTIGQLATDFVDKVPEHRFSAAEILNHLLQHRQSPSDAVASTEAWVTAMLCDKRGRPDKRTFDIRWHPRLCLSAPTSTSTSFDTRPDTSSNKFSTESCSSFPAKRSFGIGLDSPYQANLSVSPLGGRSGARISCEDSASTALETSPNLSKDSLTEVQRERNNFKRGEYSDSKASHDLSASRANFGFDEPPSPPPLLAPSPEPSPNDFERIRPNMLTEEKSFNDGVWMRKYQRPKDHCLNDLFVKNDCPVPARRDPFLVNHERIYCEKDGTTDLASDLPPRETSRDQSADLDGRSPTPHPLAQVKEGSNANTVPNSIRSDRHQMSRLGGASSQNGEAAQPAAYVENIGNADTMRIDGPSTADTTCESLRNPASFDVRYIPMLSGEWYVDNAADTSKDNQSSNVRATEGPGTQDTVTFHKGTQFNDGDFSLGIDVDARLRALPEEEQLKYNALLGIGLDSKPSAGDDQRAVVEEAGSPFNVLPQPTDEHTALWKFWCCDGQSTTAPGHANSPSSQIDSTHDIPLSAGLSELASEERLQSETNDSPANDHVSKDWTLIETDDSPA